MKRREFLAAAAVAPFSLSLLPKPHEEKLGRPVFKVIDYSLTAKDKFGWLYRRELVHPDIDPVLVKHAKYCWGALLVVMHDFDVAPVWCEYRESTRRFIASKLYLGRHNDKTLWGLIKKNDWKILQYDGCGRLVVTLTEKDFHNYEGYAQCSPSNSTL